MDNTNAERQARWRERRQTQAASVAAELAQAKARIAELESATRDEEALRNARATITKLEARIAELESRPSSGAPEMDPLERLGRFKTDAEWRAFRDGIKVARREARQKQQPKPPKPPKPQLDPESAAARQIKSLQTQLKNLRAQIAWENRYRRNRMTPETFRTIVKALHPDVTPSAKERERACQLFNALFGNGAPSA